MIKKILTIMILLSLLTISISAYTINTTVTDKSITYDFSPNIDKQAEIYFDNEKINFWVENNLTMCDLEPETCYRLTIEDLPDTVQSIHITTLSSEEIPFYADYGVLGLVVLIVILLVLSAKIEYISYLAILLSTTGYIYIQKTEPDFLTALLFAILIIISILISVIKLKKE